MGKFLAIFGIGMGAFFLFVGISMMFANPAPVLQWLQENELPMFLGKVGGFLVFVYGIFRITKSIRFFKNAQQQQA